jgi:hypothetical protein
MRSHQQYKIKAFKLIVFVFTFGLLGISLQSCSGDEEVDKDPEVEVSNSDELVGIETLFDKDEFENPKMKTLLSELNLCSEKTSTDSLDYMNPSCTPRYFRFFNLTEKMPIENGFILQVKAKVSGFPLRRMLVFVRERGELVKVNGFVANLIGRRKTTGEYDDLLLRFNDNVDGETTFYNCFFKWNGGKYEFSSVEVIEGANWGGPVKAQFKDSMSNEIKAVLTKNSMLF